MENGAIAVGSFEQIKLIPPGMGVRLCPASFAHEDSLIEKTTGEISQAIKSWGRYFGNSPYFHLWRDSDEILAKKDARLATAIALHKRFTAHPDVEMPFCLFTEPFGRSPLRWDGGRFGQIDMSDRFCRNLVSVLSEMGIDWISISQNRIREDNIARATIEMAARLQNAGIETTLSWQCWAGWGSWERVSDYHRRADEAGQFGIGSYLGEVGVRYSSTLSQGKNRNELIRDEERFVQKLVLPTLLKQLEEEESPWVWWPGNPWTTPQAGGLMAAASIFGIDFLSEEWESELCLGEGSSRWGVGT